MQRKGKYGIGDCNRNVLRLLVIAFYPVLAGSVVSLIPDHFPPALNGYDDLKSINRRRGAHVMLLNETVRMRFYDKGRFD
jgi:hypothetical protein